MSERTGDRGAGRVGRALESLAGSSSRRGFLARLGGAMVAASAGSAVARAVKPGEAEGYHFCGHIFTTDSCPHPATLPRINRDGFPIHPVSGKAIDNIGRLVDDDGHPVDERGERLLDPDGRPLPPAPRTRTCDETARKFGFETWVDGGWYRCCGGTVRKLVDCCSYSDVRINGDEALEGYCYSGRKVFCVMYYQTKVPC